LLPDVANLFVNPLYKSDREIILAAVKENGDVFGCDHNFKDDDEIIREALKNSGNAIEFMNQLYKDNEELVKLAIAFPVTLEPKKKKLETNPAIAISEETFCSRDFFFCSSV
jgi:hypothetical protein